VADDAKRPPILEQLLRRKQPEQVPNNENARVVDELA